MNPIDLIEGNRTLGKPESMTHEECVSLKVFDNGDEMTSAWQPDADELRLINEGYPVYLTIVGRGHPPVRVSAYPPAFEAKVLVVDDEPKLEEPIIDLADAQQAFIEGIISKIAEKRITHNEAMVMALGRTCTVMMESVAELRLMADSLDPLDTEASRANGARLAVTYKALVDTMRQDIDRFMHKTKMVQLVKRPKIK